MKCPKCSSAATATDRFCEVCGFSLGKAAPAAAAASSLEESADACLAVVSDMGRRHKINQDAGAVGRGKHGTAVLVVADGVSSSRNAREAAETAVRIAYRKLIGFAADEKPEDIVRCAILEAHEAVLALPCQNGKNGEDGPETTIVTALADGSRAIIGWIGDSRAYLIADSSERLMTRDDSWSEEVVESGEMTREQAMADSRAHYITQALGMRDDTPEVHLTEVELRQHEMLLLCTDGLWKYFDKPHSLAQTMGNHAGADAIGICRDIVRLCNEAGGHDNITAALLIVRDQT